jgi:homoserine O-acetyltransferase
MKGLAREREGWRRRLSTVTGVRLFVALVFLAGAATPQARQTAPAFERREFVLHDFRMESGVVLPEARVVYTTLGTLNAAGDNAVLLPSRYMANFNGYDWLIGEANRSDAAGRAGAVDRALDPARDFIVLTELFGNGRSSSPSNTPEPFHGPRFPKASRGE